MTGLLEFLEQSSSETNSHSLFQLSLLISLIHFTQCLSCGSWKSTRTFLVKNKDWIPKSFSRHDIGQPLLFRFFQYLFLYGIYAGVLYFADYWHSFVLNVLSIVTCVSQYFPLHNHEKFVIHLVLWHLVISLSCFVLNVVSSNFIIYSLESALPDTQLAFYLFLKFILLNVHAQLASVPQMS
jgi:hypothetical protein